MHPPNCHTHPTTLIQLPHLPNHTHPTTLNQLPHLPNHTHPIPCTASFFLPPAPPTSRPLPLLLEMDMRELHRTGGVPAKLHMWSRMLPSSMPSAVSLLCGRINRLGFVILFCCLKVVLYLELKCYPVLSYPQNWHLRLYLLELGTGLIGCCYYLLF